MKKLNSGFMVGASTAAHQVEGNNIHSDFWALEQMEHSSFAEPSLDAVDHYNRYEEDIRLMAEAGLNAYRFSIEWARIQPQEGRFNEKEAEHYRDVIRCCKKYGIEPVVTLHHFSSPAWIISKGGWEADSVVSDFEAYVRYIIGKLGSELNYVCTINEANMGVQVAQIAKQYMAQMKAMAGKGGSMDGSVQMGINLEKMMENAKAAEAETEKIFGTKKAETFTSPRTGHGDELVCKAHEAARAAIKELFPQIRVGLTLSLHDLQVQEGGREQAERLWEEEFLHYLPVIAEDDFLGVQCYTRTRVNHNGAMTAPEGALLTQMDYEYYPQAIGNVLRTVTRDFHGELLVTENGIAIGDDELRVRFIKEATDSVQGCVEDGIPVKGYFYWSLLDNFEWQKGFSMTFGLIAVERSTQKRMPKPSLTYLGSIWERRNGYGKGYQKDCP